MNTNQPIVTKITCTTSTLNYAEPEDEFLSPIGDILISVAQKYLAQTKEDMSQWLTFAQVTALCRRYHHTLPFRSYRLQEICPEILALFRGRDSIQRSGIKIRYQSRDEHPQYLRVAKTVHCLKFFRTPML